MLPPLSNVKFRGEDYDRDGSECQHKVMEFTLSGATTYADTAAVEYTTYRSYTHDELKYTYLMIRTKSHVFQ